MPQVTLLVVAQAANIAGLRARLPKHLRGWGIGPAVEHEVQVVVSNLFAAALLHGRGGQMVSVRLSVGRGALVVEVMTGSTASPPRRSDARPIVVQLPPILAILTTSSGVEERPYGRRFWAKVAVPSARRAPRGRRRASALLSWLASRPLRRRRAA
ncbi:hypothetical protein [Kitasatospora indigofera]|uniref:hypothetical protein n=1 Tax=Kitasatospora indigofera TaxID=67307 RepID=UPI0033A4C1FD